MFLLSFQLSVVFRICPSRLRGPQAHMTPLMHASAAGQEDAVVYLLEAKANLLKASRMPADLLFVFFGFVSFKSSSSC